MDNNTVFLDIETTGLEPPNEIVEVGILAYDGSILVHSLIKPLSVKKWPHAERIHGIKPIDVANAPSLDEVRPLILAALKGKELVIYNASFERKFLPNEIAVAKDVKCAMLEFADTYGSERWLKLTFAADFVNFKYNAHSAIEDCKATIEVWKYCNQ